MNRNFRHVPRTLGALTFAATVTLAALGIAGTPAGTERSARPLIGDFTGELAPAGFSIRRVWLLGLDHRRVGGRVGVTSSRGWSTPFGPVTVDGDGVGALLDTRLAADAPEVVWNPQTSGNDLHIDGIIQVDEGL